MLLKQLLEVYDLLDRSDASGGLIKGYMEGLGATNLVVKQVFGGKGSTDFVKIKILGKDGKTMGGTSPTMGILGRLGGIGARPEITGFVSDGDGALSALTVAAKILDMQSKGDILDGDVIVSTHICPNAPTQPHFPTPFMGSPIDMEIANQEELDNDMDAVLSIDTTKGNKIINNRGFAISNTVKEGYILKISNDLVDIMSMVTGRLPVVFPISIQDITPYGNDLYHINSILQPATATDVPVVGIAITTETPVAGCATGASHFVDIELASRFVLEVAKAYGKKICNFYDEEEFQLILKKYGKMKHLQTKGS